MFQTEQPATSLIQNLARAGVIDPFGIPRSDLVALSAEDEAIVAAGGAVVVIDEDSDGTWAIVLCTQEGHRRIFTPHYGHASRADAARILALNVDMFDPRPVFRT